MIHYITTNGIQNPWVASELKKVGDAGIPVRLHAIRKPNDLYHDSEWARDLHAQTRSIYPVSIPGFIWSVLTAPLRHRYRLFSAIGGGLLEPRESLMIRLKMLVHIFVAAHWLRLNEREDFRHVHAQWAHASGSIAMYAAWLAGVSWSFTGHAADLYRDRCGLVEKVKRADFICCISTFHRDFYVELGADPAKLIMVYCGIDVDLFAGKPRAGGWRERPLRLLSTGRLVEKKGFDTFIEACRILKDRGLRFTCTIGGSGPLESELRGRIAAAGLDHVVTVTGRAMKQEEIPGIMAEHDLFVLACQRARDGDVDGLPQMLMEAMACGLPVVSTRLVGTPDLVVHEKTGLLAEAGDPAQISHMIERLYQNPELARELATAGHRHVKQHFNLDTCVEPLIERFREIEVSAPLAQPGYST